MPLKPFTFRKPLDPPPKDIRTYMCKYCHTRSTFDANKSRSHLCQCGNLVVFAPKSGELEYRYS